MATEIRIHEQPALKETRETLVIADEVKPHRFRIPKVSLLLAAAAAGVACDSPTRLSVPAQEPVEKAVVQVTDQKFSPLGEQLSLIAKECEKVIGAANAYNLGSTSSTAYVEIPSEVHKNYAHRLKTLEAELKRTLTIVGPSDILSIHLQNTRRELANASAEVDSFVASENQNMQKCIHAELGATKSLLMDTTGLLAMLSAKPGAPTPALLPESGK